MGPRWELDTKTDWPTDRWLQNNLILNHWSKPNAREYNWATLFLVEINTGTWPSRLESKK
jgi:hypothetical protein